MDEILRFIGNLDESGPLGFTVFLLFVLAVNWFYVQVIIWIGRFAWRRPGLAAAWGAAIVIFLALLIGADFDLRWGSVPVSLLGVYAAIAQNRRDSQKQSDLDDLKRRVAALEEMLRGAIDATPRSSPGGSAPTAQPHERKGGDPAAPSPSAPRAAARSTHLLAGDVPRRATSPRTASLRDRTRLASG